MEITSVSEEYEYSFIYNIYRPEEKKKVYTRMAKEENEFYWIFHILRNIIDCDGKTFFKP